MPMYRIMINKDQTKRSAGYIQRLIAQGEHEQQDFKYQITDAKKIAHSIAAFANHSGGHLLIGVKDNGNIVGVSSDEEIYMVELAAQMYCKPEQKVKFDVYRINGKNVVKADIAEADVKPVKAPDGNNKWRVYYRVGDENILASDVHAQVLSHLSRQYQDPSPGETLSYSEHEQQLLEYLRNHGALTVEGYMKMARISRLTAEQSVVGLCSINVLTLHYHDGKMTISLKN